MVIADLNGNEYTNAPTHPAIIDTGADVTVIPKTVAVADLGLTSIKDFANRDVECVDTIVELQHPLFGKVRMEAKAVRDLPMILLGRDFMMARVLGKNRTSTPLTLILDWKSGQWHLGESSTWADFLRRIYSFFVRKIG